MLTKEQRQCRDVALVYNLRFAHKAELLRFNDSQLVEMYNDFAVSEYYGNNDEHFLQFIIDCVD